MLSNDLLTTLIADFQERWIPEYVERDREVDVMPGKISTIFGPRRAGKTFLLYQLADEAVSRGLPREAVLYANLEDERILPMDAEDLGRLVDLFGSRLPEIGDRVPLVLLDEVQNVPDWQMTLRRLADNLEFRIVISGSSADLLSRELSTRLRGRSLGHELLPFSFGELARVRGLTPENRSTRVKLSLDDLLREHLLWGGYPEVWLRADTERIKRKVLQEYFSMTFYRDLVDRHGVANTDLLKYLLKYLAANNGSLFSVNRFHKHLKAQGLGASQDTLHLYLAYAEDALLFHPVPIYSRSVKEQRVNPRKYYCVDAGLRNAVSPPGHPDLGRLAENVVYLELRRRGFEVFYWRDKVECDFVAVRNDKPEMAIQVAWSIDTPQVLQREMEGLAAVAERFPTARPLLLAGSFSLPEALRPSALASLPDWLLGR